MRKRKSNTVYAAINKSTGKETGRWVFKNPVGDPSYYKTKKAAERARANWRPQITRLIRDNYIQKGDKLNLCFSGYYDSDGGWKKIPLTVEDVKGTTMMFSYIDNNGNVKVKSLLEIKKAVAARKGDAKKMPSLNPWKTIHLESNKSIHQLKNQYVEDLNGNNEESAEEPPVEAKQLNFLDFFAESDLESSSPDLDEKVIHLPDVTPKQNNVLGDYKEEFCTYLESQAAAIENISHLSDEDKLKLCKANLMSLLSM